ncbi:MAG: VCBS repeat-containing protein [Phycisphaerales bacterium]
MNTLAALTLTCSLSTLANAQTLNGFVAVENPSGILFDNADINDAVLSDFDADGDLDVALLLSALATSPSDPFNDTSYWIRFFSNDGTGVFTAVNEVMLRDGDGLRFVLRAGDLNHDGLPDLVTSSRRYSSSGPSDDKLIVIRNLGGFGFLLPLYYNSPGAYHDIEIHDMDGDGNSDILAASAFDQVNYHKGNGSGTIFSLFDTIETGNGSTTGDGPNEIEIADFNLDGRPDIACSNFNSRDLSLLYQRSNGLFWDSVLTTINAHGLTSPRKLIASDINQDGETDLLLGHNGDIRTFLNDYDGGSESFPNFNDSAGTIPGTPSADDIVLARIDCTNDTVEELVSGNARVRVFGGLGGGGFSPSPLYTSPEITLLEGIARVLVGDVDLDGDIDILHADRIGNLFGGGDIVLLRNRCQELPCPADFSDDRMLTFFDVSQFLQAYNAGDPSADLNGDDIINFFDVSAFLTSYNKGCPD